MMYGLKSAAATFMLTSHHWSCDVLPCKCVSLVPPLAAGRPEVWAVMPLFSQPYRRVPQDIEWLHSTMPRQLAEWAELL